MNTTRVGLELGYIQSSNTSYLGESSFVESLENPTRGHMLLIAWVAVVATIWVTVGLGIFIWHRAARERRLRIARIRKTLRRKEVHDAVMLKLAEIKKQELLTPMHSLTWYLKQRQPAVSFFGVGEITPVDSASLASMFIYALEETDDLDLEKLRTDDVNLPGSNYDLHPGGTSESSSRSSPGSLLSVFKWNSQGLSTPRLDTHSDLLGPHRDRSLPGSLADLSDRQSDASD